MKKACSKGARGQRRPARGETPASLPAAPPKHGTPFVSSNAAGRSAACAEAEPALGARRSSIARIPRAPATPASRLPPRTLDAAPAGREHAAPRALVRMAGQASRAERPLKTAEGRCGWLSADSTRTTQASADDRTGHARKTVRARGTPGLVAERSVLDGRRAHGDGPHAAHRAAAATALRHSGSATAFPTISGRAKFSLLLN